MAYRRKHPGVSESPSTLRVEEEEGLRNPIVPQPPSLAAKAIRASSAHRDSSLSAAYSGYAAPSSSSYASSRSSSYSTAKDPNPTEYASAKSSEESKHGFWGALVGKAKAILDDDSNQQSEKITNARPQISHTATGGKYHHYASNMSSQKTENPALQKGLHAITSSINYIGNAVEEGLTTVEKRTVNLIQETRKHIRKKPSSSDANQKHNHLGTWQQPQSEAQMHLQSQADLELQLKASRDVAMAMAAKAKLLLRELKTVKADLAFAKERCAQLEEENKILRENRDRGDHPEDDEMIRLQLETLLAEKARLAHANSVYARENRFLREIVEYHQLTMQDVVYLDENNEEVTEVYPIKVSSTSNLQPAPKLPPEASF